MKFVTARFLSVQFYIQIVPPGQRLIKDQEADDKDASDDKAIQVKHRRQDQQQQAHEFQRVAQLKIGLGVIGHSHKGHVQHDLRVKPP